MAEADGHRRFANHGGRERRDLPHKGSHTGATADGDKFFVHYQGTAKLKDGKPESISGAWTFVGGTGKHKTLKGKGTYKGGAPDADGNILFDVEGEYTQ